MKGILVLGPGRSGTSALTRVINLLGPSVCIPDDRMGPAPANPKGFWESTTITIANELLLQLAGGSWRCLPPLGTIRERATEAVVATLRDTFTTVHPFDEWLCKDPRFSITMGFWEEVLGCDPIAVIPVRDPRQVAASYERSFPTGPVPAAAIWERSMRAGLAQAAGGPAVVASFDQVLAGLDDWCEATVAFLSRHGFEQVGPPDQGALTDFVDEQLFGGGSSSETELSDEQRSLFEFASALIGHHDALDTAGLPAETTSTAERIDACLLSRRGQPFPDAGSPGALGGGIESRTATVYNVIRVAYDAALMQTS